MYQTAASGIITGMPTGTRPEPDTYEIALAGIVRMLMAGKQPAWSQSDLAKRTGIPQTTISRLLQPRTGMTVRQAKSIADALGVDLGNLMANAHSVAAGREDTHAAASRLVG